MLCSQQMSQLPGFGAMHMAGLCMLSILEGLTLLSAGSTAKQGVFCSDLGKQG